jgi:hypothetical protein
MLPPRSGRPSLARTVAATALATLVLNNPAPAQTMTERARAAATAARARSGDSDSLRANYLTPGLAGQPVATVDGTSRFTPTIACQKTATLLEVMVQPAATGDLGLVRIARDTDLDGTIDTTATLPIPVSGICANGVIACRPGSWEQCIAYRWDVDGARALKLTEVNMPALAGCYCLNNSCGPNLAWANLASILGDLGGGMVGALTSADPRIGVAQAMIDGPVIRYVGAQSTACTSDPSLAQTQYRANPASLASDADAASRSSPIFEALAGSPIGVGTSEQLRHCTIERQVTVVRPAADAIITRTAGGYSTLKTGSAFDFLLGSPADDSLRGGSCSLIDFRMTLHVTDPDRIVNASLERYFADDWAQVRIDGSLIASGPTPWSTTGLPPGKCEKKATFQASPDIDLKPWLTVGDHEIWLRIAVADRGEGMAQVHVVVDESCRTSEQVVDGCGPIASDPQCRIDSELVDGVQTFRGAINTGLHPLPQTRVMGSDSCPVELTRDFFLKDRTYRCQVDGASLPTPDTSRGAYIIDHSTESLLADRVRVPSGPFAETTRSFALPDRGSVPACEPVCKTRAPHRNVAAAPAGVVGSLQNDPASFDTFYHACSADAVCPAGPDEQIVSSCGCLDDFPEAVVMMQTVRLAGADLVCTAAPR